MKLIKPTCTVRDDTEDSICQICPKAKQTRNSFPTSCIETTLIFELLNVNVWGPYKVKNHYSCNQFVTIVDDYSRYTWVTLIKFKSNVASVFSSFINYVEKQFSRNILTICSDNAKEFTEGYLKSFFHSKGIVHQTSCSYTPQQNGVVERKHRHLLETARALHFQSNFPNHYWGDSILCTTYLINRMPIKSIHHNTPYSRLYNSTHSFGNLRVYGCLCYISTIKLHRTKFSFRATPCIFLGYPPH